MRYDTKSFILKAKEIHKNKYNYKNVNYKNCKKKVNIICNDCGNDFWQVPDNHLH